MLPHPHPALESQTTRLEPTPPPAAVPPGPVPAAPPLVSYRNGLLTITAENADLREVMDRVRDSMGAEIDALPVDERITVDLGPQPPAQVIAALLAGMHVNYVILGGLADPNAIRAIQFTAESAAVPEPPRPAVDSEAIAARTRALIVAETGGDEGVWDDAEAGVPVPAASVSAPASSLPAQAVPPAPPVVPAERN